MSTEASTKVDRLCTELAFLMKSVNFNQIRAENDNFDDFGEILTFKDLACVN